MNSLTCFARHFVLVVIVAVFALLVSLSAHSALPVITKTTPFPGSTLYLPNDGNAHPGIVMLHGSEGGAIGSQRTSAQLLAMDGFAVLVFCWYDCKRSVLTDPISTLANVNLENSFGAIRWLRNSPYVKGHDVGVFGVSRGAEQALILTAFSATEPALPRIAAVAVHAPSDVVVQGFSWNWNDKRCWICVSGGTDCYGQSDLSRFKWNPVCGVTPTGTAADDFPAWYWRGVALPLGGRIEIERFAGPVLITHGMLDEVWDVARTRRIEATLRAAGRAPEVHYYEGEGHGFKNDAELDRKEKVHDFFKRHLK